MKVRQAFTTLLFVLTNKPEAKARAAEKATQKPPKMRASATSEAKLPTPDTVPTKSSAATSSNKRKREDAADAAPDSKRPRSTSDEVQATVYIANPQQPIVKRCGVPNCNVDLSHADIDTAGKHINSHLTKPKGEKTKLRCPWAGCNCHTRYALQRRHVLKDHMEVQFICHGCNVLFDRQDVLCDHKKHNACVSCTLALFSV